MNINLDTVFLNIVDPIFSCCTDAVENTEHYLLRFLFSDNVNSGIIYAAIKLIESTNRFSGSIYD